MNKKTLASVLLVVAALVLSACSAGAQDADSKLIAKPAATSPASEYNSGASALPGTRWGLLSIKAKGETEKQSSTTPSVQFCRDGRWAMGHYGGALQGGKYQTQGGRVRMTYEDGRLFGDFQIKRNGEEMLLDDGKYVLRMKYLGGVDC